MTSSGRYDSTLQMFVDDERSPDINQLRYLRWLAERGLLEHEVVGASSGPCTVVPTEAQE